MRTRPPLPRFPALPRLPALATLSALTLLLAPTLLLTGCGGSSPDGPKATLQADLSRTDAQLSWRWTLRNDDTVPIVILDGPVDGTTDLPQVWIVPGEDGTVEVAYRFLAPPDGVDVARPVLQAGHTLAPGASTSGTAQVTLPLTVRHPYASAFTPPLTLPTGDADVQFCIGVVRADDVKPQPGGSYAHVESAAKKQRLICADG